MGTRKSLNLDTFIHNRCYFKSETYTRAETNAKILEEISKLTLVEYVASLPTSNIKTNRLYIVPNNKNINQNLYDIYIYYNNKWERIDSLEFNIADYPTKTEMNAALALKSDKTHRHDNAVANSSDGFMSKEDKSKLDGIAAGATKITVDSSLSAGGTNPVQGKAIYNALNGKAASDHNHDSRYYTQEQIDDKLSNFIDEEGRVALQGYYKSREIDEMMANKVSSITVDEDLIMEIRYD
ncbi:hypothetical protein [Methanobrevibacter sp.]|uniref:hypothetical protein n=1 Tax=Methanobrevibacter sp. TaxID=66852 RepID=UPI003863F14E